MAHKTKVDGTIYTIKGGKAKKDGTIYNIKQGKTLVEGTVYNIVFSTDITIRIEGTVTLTTGGLAPLPLAGVSIGDDETIYSSPNTFTVPKGTMFAVYVGAQNISDIDYTSITTSGTTNPYNQDLIDNKTSKNKYIKIFVDELYESIVVHIGTKNAGTTTRKVGTADIEFTTLHDVEHSGG